ncbi:MAG TPA: permease [Clostridium sp.]|nr:permease [Clostridium sp.]
MKKILKRYRYFLLLLVINIVLIFIIPDIGISAFLITKNNVITMLGLIPPIFILLGLLDIWIEKETMMKYMGENSGLKGSVLAFIMGSAAAGPLYAAFPIAGVLLKKGVSLFNVFLFIGAWSVTKIPMLLFEATSLGMKFMAVRFGCNLIGIILIAFILSKFSDSITKKKIYENAERF